MIFLVALGLALFVLPYPWGLIAVVVAGVLEIGETALFVWWSQRRRASVGVESIVGKEGVVLSALGPEGQVKVDGEIWRAHCDGGCETGSRIVVRAVDGLTLEVEPA